jgi:NADP-dependent aldehyde dehydrogenase
VDVLAAKAGRVLWNGWPTGVSVSYAQQHGGPYPATTAPHFTSVGTASIARFLRPVAYQDAPDAVLPPALQEANPWGIPRLVDGAQE